MVSYDNLPQMVEKLLKGNSDLLFKVEELNRKVEGHKEKPLLTKEQCADLLSIHINSVDNRVKDGEFNVYYQGTKPYYKRDEVLAFIYSQNKAG